VSAPGIARMQVWYAGGAVQQGRSTVRLYNGHSESPVCPGGSDRNAGPAELSAKTVWATVMAEAAAGTGRAQHAVERTLAQCRHMERIWSDEKNCEGGKWEGSSDRPSSALDS